MLVGDGHRFSQRDSVSVTELAEEPLLFAAEERAPELNQLVGELCRTAGFTRNRIAGRCTAFAARLGWFVTCGVWPACHILRSGTGKPLGAAGGPDGVLPVVAAVAKRGRE